MTEEVVGQIPGVVYSTVYVATADSSGVIIPVIGSIINPVGLAVKLPDDTPVIVGVTVPIVDLQ